MVVCASGLASEVGAAVLKRGGNAVDAAVAVGLALAVTWPAAGNLGGGGFMVIRLANGRATAIDYREVAPAAAHRSMYLDEAGKPVPGASLVGYRAAGVPGTVAGLSLALEKYGTMKWRDVVEPARRLAADGFPVTPALARDLRRSRLLDQFPESRRIFLRDRRPYEAGEILRQPDLAQTLQRIGEKGAREFYQGRTAALVAADMEANGGLITLRDLKRYRAVERRPLRGAYRGVQLVTMPPPSSGGVALLEILHLLERQDLRSLGPASPQKHHLVIEAMRRAFADRAEFMGDPDFVRVPVAGLISPRYADEVRKSIDPARATPSAQVGHGRPWPYESAETTHYSIVDAAGNAVANTYTLNGAYGCGATVRGAGFLLNNEMDDFAARPGSPNGYGLVQGEANAIAPRKRPLSSMAPTILLRSGRLYGALGSPGGPTIISTLLQVILNLVDHDMDLQSALDAPRIHHQWLPDVVEFEPGGLGPAVMEDLKARGHRLAGRPLAIGDVAAVMVDPASGDRLAGVDPRSPDAAAAGY
jgi:gamma-glutamyltranspeptidase/glutathione hydrolase